MDLLTVLLNALGLGLLVFTAVTARWALRGFRQSRQALREAASYVTVIVGALSKRIEPLEVNAMQLRNEIDNFGQGKRSLQEAQSTLQLKYDALSKSIQDLVATDKQVLQEIEQLRSRLSLSRPQNIERAQSISPPMDLQESVLERLTPTERDTLNSLLAGPLSAPQMSKLLNKSREHTARLLKRLYMEGFVDRDSIRAPFRYKLNDKLRSSIGGSETTPPATEKT
jgi:chromosome segregation ATPase